MNFSILTLGCKVNQSESNSIGSDLINSGHKLIPLSRSTDVCIINTCTVTAKSDYQSRQYIRRALSNGSKVLVTGCYSELNLKDIKKISPEIEIINNKNKIFDIKELCGIREYNTLGYNTGRSRAFVKIQDGCDFGCTYCAVRLARGKSISVDKDIISDEINRIYNSGVNEVVLTGIHIGLYGKDLGHDENLNNLLKFLLINTGIPRIRLSSLEVNEIDDEFLDTIADNRICRHLHIPLQSGDDNILKSMARRYTTREYHKKLAMIFNKYPDISIGSDIIVGFPGEDKKEFDNTLNFVKDEDFSYLHIFPYSMRNHTPAAALPGHAGPGVKRDRVNILREISKEKKKLYMNKFAGRTLDVIIESKIDDSFYTSTSGNYLKVHVKATDVGHGTLISVNVTGLSEGYLAGIPIVSS
ncbi:threonylcarbamoyladenosine tRNA methylthiotransferase MtaB [bacterium BMS3Bbin05]|nr:threonylcarbamoyladenosine tRNA methylthiotransferase MtaB [bacterium BMS3Bbin05]